MRRGTAWTPRAGNETSHILNCNWEIFSAPGPSPKVAPVPTNAYADEIPRYAQLHAAQVDQWHQMVNAEDILKQQLLGSLEENYFKGESNACTNYAKHTLTGLIQHLYDEHVTISPMDIEESEQKLKQEWSLLNSLVDFFNLV